MLTTRMNGFALIVLALAPAALAQDSTPLKLSLKDAVTLALRQNPQVILANLEDETYKGHPGYWAKK